jgi:hypothetical protein
VTASLELVNFLSSKRLRILTKSDLVVDFQQLVTLQRVQMTALERLASLDSPFAEALLARFGRYFGRLSTPDLDVEVILSRLRSGTGGG